ncbi:MAG: helix-turn-helix transcriptional regulator [Acholeplasmatales bacterium]|nr:helix-turn-helix transcriptional regulator [Acholeplasmatales bacterium]
MNIEVASRLQKLRKQNGYSQEELADKLGISRQAVSKWERAEASPDTDNLILLARLYNMSLDDLLYDNETNEEIKNRTIDKEEKEEIKKNTITLTDDEGQTVKIENNKITCFDKDGNEVKVNNKRKAIVGMIDGIVFLIVLIAYFMWSFLANAWYVSWVLWVLLPAIMSIAEAIETGRFSKFLYPCLVTALYLYLGMEFKLWHPYWFLFITIPVFYIITGTIDKLRGKEDDCDCDDDDKED